MRSTVALRQRFAERYTARQLAWGVRQMSNSTLIAEWYASRRDLIATLFYSGILKRRRPL
jgi:hypothetical protein